MQSMRFLLTFAAIIQTISMIATIPLLAGPPLGHIVSTHGTADVADVGASPAGQWSSHGGEL